MKYTEWQLINEAIGSGIPLGLRNPNIVGGPLGSTLRESPIEDDVDDEDEDEDEDEDADDDEDLDGDIMGGTEDDGIDPLKSFPPDNSEDMDGLPTPDEEMIDGDEAPAAPGGDVPPELGADDEMGDTLAGIDPDLAGLGGDEGVPPEGEVPPEIADAGPGMDLPDDMGAVADIPCPECNPEAEVLPGEGQPDCPTCGGEGFISDDGGLGGEEMPPELGDDLGGEEMPPELGDDLGGEEMPPELGDEELGDDLDGEELGDLDAEIEDKPEDDKDAEMARRISNWYGRHG